MPLALGDQHSFVTSSYLNPFTDLTAKAVIKLSSYPSSKFGWSVLRLFNLMLLYKAFTSLLPTSIFVNMFLGSGVQISTAFSYIDAFV